MNLATWFLEENLYYILECVGKRLTVPVQVEVCDTLSLNDPEKTLTFHMDF